MSARRSMSLVTDQGVRTADCHGARWVVASEPWDGDRAPSICFDRDGRRWCAMARDDGDVWLCALDDDGHVRERFSVAGARSHEVPSVTCWRDKLCVAVVDADGALFLACAKDPSKLRFRKPASMAVAKGAPSIAATSARLHVAFRGTDDRVYVGSSDDGRSIGYCAVSMPRRAASSPTLAAWGSHIALCAIDHDGHVYTASSFEGVELKLALRGGAAITRSSPAIALRGRELHALLVGTDDRVYQANCSIGDDLDFSIATEFGAVTGDVRLACARADEPTQPSRSSVIPVLFFARDVARTGAFVETVQSLLDQHLQRARARYLRWLETDTFAVGETVVVDGARPLAAYSGPDAWERVRREVLAARADNNETSLATYVILVARGDSALPEDWFGAAGPNRAEGSGAAILELSSLLEDTPYPFQSTVVHELGHAFGLPHVDAYGEPMDTCESIMSYNPRHWTRGLALPEPDATLLPEELFALAQNEVAFPRFSFDPAKHNPTRRPLRLPQDD